MPDYVADDYSDIARRHAELYGVLAGQSVPAKRWGIWYAAPDRPPGWCRVDSVVGKWSLVRTDEDPLPTLFDSEIDARECIDNKPRGAWDTTLMSPRVFEGF